MDRLTCIAVLLGILAASRIDLARADDPQSLTDRLTNAGLTPVLTYEGDVATNASGGERRGSTYSGILHMQFDVDGDRLAGLPGLSAHFDGLWINGGQPSKLVGDAQGVSNIAAPDAVRLYEAWLQYNSPGSRLSILVGRYDLNTEFYRLVSAGLFLNSSFGIGPEFGQSGFAGPSIFPDTSLGVRVAYKPSPNTVLRAAILDGAPLDQQNGSPNPFNPHDGVLLVAEAVWLTRPSALAEPEDYRFRIGRRGTPFAYDDKVAVGAWYYTARFEEPGAANSAGNPAQHHGEGGAYVLLDRLLFQSRDDPKRRLTGFLQLGVADQAVDRFGTFAGAGLVMAGLLPNRPDDELGVAVAMAHNGSAYIAGQQQAALPVNAAETALELSYLVQVDSRVAVQPDVQYVIHPNTDPRLANATVVQLRFELTY
jgi:porin